MPKTVERLSSKERIPKQGAEGQPKAKDSEGKGKDCRLFLLLLLSFLSSPLIMPSSTCKAKRELDGPGLGKGKKGSAKW